MSTATADIQIRPCERIYGHAVVTVRGVVHFVGARESAETIYYALVNKALGGDRAASDQALQRALGV